MSRPPAKTILSTAIGRTAYDFSVNQVDGFWIITYKGEPVHLCRTNRYSGQRTYPKTGYAHPAHCIRMVEKLNRLFKTTDFDLEKVA